LSGADHLNIAQASRPDVLTATKKLGETKASASQGQAERRPWHLLRLSWVRVGVSDGDTLTARCGVEGAYEQIKVRAKQEYREQFLASNPSVRTAFRFHLIDAG
jgi:hypothetical protein